jgi:hypothetical protein
MRSLVRLFALLACVMISVAEARVVRLRIDRREPVLNGKAFGTAGAYEKLVGQVEFALNPSLAANAGIVDLKLAPRNAAGEVEFTADFYLLKPVDPAQFKGRLLYEVGNRGGKALLATFQKAVRSADPTTEAEFGDGRLMAQGYALLWMGWQWDVPEGRMRMQMPIATEAGQPIKGRIRGNFILDARSNTAPLADRAHQAYPIADMADPEAFLTVRDRTDGKPQRLGRGQWRFVDNNTVALEGGFEPGRIYDVVYTAKDPRVLGTGLAGTRDLISFFKHATVGNPLPGVKDAIGWGISQSGRFLRHLLYEGFNEDEQGRRVFDGVIDEVGGAGRGSFNHRFGQASRDAEQFFNFLYPVDMFPFTDGDQSDPVTGAKGSLLGRAQARGVEPKMFHVLSNSEYFNRAGSLVHTDVAGQRDIEPPANVRIYTVAAGPHFAGPFPPSQAAHLAAPLNPLNRNLIMRALLDAMDRWMDTGTAPPPSQMPRIANKTLTPSANAGWPTIPGVKFPPPVLITYRLDFGPRWAQGIVDYEPPLLGKPYAALVPAVDKDGNAIAGIRMPSVQIPIGTYTGWNYRPPAIGAPEQFSGEAGAFFPFAATREARLSTGDSRLSFAERYTSRDEYLARIRQAARQLIQARFLLAADLPEVEDFAKAQFDWMSKPPAKP